MNKIKSLIIVSIFFLSCQNQEKNSLINNSNSKRVLNLLNKLDKKLKLDSTSFVKSDENDWQLLNYIVTYKSLKLSPDEKLNKFAIIDFYSNSSNGQFKTIYYIRNKGILKLVSEQDRFYKKLNDTIEIYLNHNYNYLKNEAIYSIDSLPTKLFIKKNKKKLKQMIVYAKKNNSELCGTAANEILRDGFPNRNTTIKYSKFKKIKLELNRQN